MTRIKLRDFRTEEQEHAFYADRYPEGYKHQAWPDHVERVAASIDFIKAWHADGYVFDKTADLSCGDGAIVRGLHEEIELAYLGDLNGMPADVEGITIVPQNAGLVQDTITHLPDHSVDLFILSETLEHVQNPEGLLRHIAYKSRSIFISTPLSEKPETGNPEHYWSWGAEDVSDMLKGAGWNPIGMKLLQPLSTRHMANAYTYQFWFAVRSDA